MIASASRLAVLALAAVFVAAAPTPGGYFDSKGNWIDDGYYAWSKGPKTCPFVPWSGDDCSSSSGSTTYQSSGSYSGQATFFFQGGNAGACGSVHSDSDYVVALDSRMYNGGAYCGRTLTITNTDTGATSKATVADECPSCSSSTSLDLSQGLFDSLGSESQGVLPITWYFN